MKAYMKNYIDAALTFMESKEMHDYLHKELPRLHWAARGCAVIVAYAPAPIERKLPVLEQIAREPDPEVAFDGKPFTAYAARFARSCHLALEERHNGPEGVVFSVESGVYNEDADVNTYPRALFTDFDAALRYLERMMEEYPEEYVFEGLSHTVTKYVPDSSGQLTEYCTWYLNNMRELWYFDYEISSRELPGDWEPPLDYLGNLNLPVPFQPGDIVVADCMPYAPSRRVLILSVGDNIDCCCLQVLFIWKNGCLDIGAFKHNQFLCNGELSHVSGLYRAIRWTGELPAEEEAFAVLAPLIRERPEFGEEIWDCFFKLERRVVTKLRREGLEDIYGGRFTPTWKIMKEALGL